MAGSLRWLSPHPAAESGCQCKCRLPTGKDYLRKGTSASAYSNDLLTYQIQELRAANLSAPDEFEQLELERQRLGHVVELQQLSYQVYQALYQNDSDAPASVDLLGQAESTLV